MKSIILLVLFLPTAAICDEKEYQEFLRDIDSAQEKIDYSEKLISHDQLHKLIKKKPEVAPSEESLVDRARRKKAELASKPGPGNNEALGASLSQHQDSNDNAGAPPAKSVVAVKNLSLSGSTDPNLNEKKPVVPVPAKPAKPTKPAPVHTAAQKPVSSPGSGVYISPALRNIGNSMSDSGPRISNNATLKTPEQRNITYGVTIGTNIDVELDTSATNVQPGYVQFVTIEDVVGYKKTLPKRTRFFGQPSAVIGSDKLFVKITNGIDPNTNQEFTLAGNAYDDEGDPGLIAYIVNDGRAIERATDAGTTALGAGLVELIPSNVATDAARASADSLLRDKQNGDLIQNGKPRYILQANPQKATIQIERTF